MKTILSRPFLLLALIVMWMLLTKFSLGNLILAVVFASLAVWSFAALDAPKSGMVRILPLLKLTAILSYDIIRSNLAVAWLILTNGRHGSRKSGFVRIQLRLKNPAALSLLAMAVTATPGTAWLQYDSESGILLLHVFDLIDEDEWRDLIRNRYEALLLEGFA